MDADRTFAVIREPVAHRVVFTVAHDIFDNWFQLELEGDEKGEQSKAFDKKVQPELTRLQAKRELTLMSVFERAYGYAILVLGYEDAADNLEDPVANPTGLREIKAYGKPQIPKVDVEKNREDPRYGLPVTYHIKRPGTVAHLKIHHSRVILFATRRSYDYKGAKKQWEGVSVLDPIWDDLVTLRNIRWSMGQTMYRYGSGFPDITFTGAELDQIEAWEDSAVFENLSARRYFIHNENQTLDFKGVAGHELNPMNYYLPIMEHISCGTGIPLAILRGVQAGALTGSEVNQQEYYGLISDEQSGYEPGIRKLVNIIRGFEPSENPGSNPGGVEFEFDWMGGFELDEEKKARIDQIKTQTLLAKGQFMTRNEIRKLMDPDLTPLSVEQGGEEILGKASSSEGFDYHIREIPKSPRRRLNHV